MNLLKLLNSIREATLPSIFIGGFLLLSLLSYNLMSSSNKDIEDELISRSNTEDSQVDLIEYINLFFIFFKRHDFDSSILFNKEKKEFLHR